LCLGLDLRGYRDHVQFEGKPEHKMKRSLAFAFTAALALICLPGLAINAAEPRNTRNISDISREAGTKISGRATHVFGNTFVLEDGTGSVLVDTGPPRFKKRQFDVGEKLTVFGEMDEQEFEAWRIERGSGSYEIIREPHGPPPWAGGKAPR